MAETQHKDTILLVDDEQEIVQFIRDALEDEGYVVLIAHDGTEALRVAQQHPPQLVILDIMMPSRDGFSVCIELREQLDIPILFLSAKQSEADKVQGFSVGADDYIMKPFSIKELVARVEAHLRRQRRSTRPVQQRTPVILKCGDLSIDMNAYEIRYRGEPIVMTRKEFEIVQLLVLHPRQIFSRETIYERIWGMDSLGSTETVTEHVKRIRRKLEMVDAATQYISTIWGVGYKWEPLPSA